MRQTHTYVTLDISRQAYDEIRAKLAAADYGHCFIDENTIDMSGIAVQPEAMEDSSVPADSVRKFQQNRHRIPSVRSPENRQLPPEGIAGSRE